MGGTNQLIWGSVAALLALRIIFGHRRTSALVAFMRLGLGAVVFTGAMIFVPLALPDLTHQAVMFLSIFAGILAAGIPSSSHF